MPPLSYDHVRALTLEAADQAFVNVLARTYQPGQRTILLLPGGMGTQLDRSLKKHPAKPPYLEYDPIWMDLGAFFDGDILELAIDEKGRDFERHVIVPNGPMRFPTLNAYDGTARYFRRQCGINFGVFG